jgi:hypothetical protein
VIRAAQDENYHEMLKPLPDSIQSMVKGNIAMDLELIKPEIKRLLEEEIVGRYYFQKGKAQYGVTQDEVIPMCIDILSNATEYNAILSASEPEKEDADEELAENTQPRLDGITPVSQVAKLAEHPKPRQIPS